MKLKLLILVQEDRNEVKSSQVNEEKKAAENFHLMLIERLLWGLVAVTMASSFYEMHVSRDSK